MLFFVGTIPKAKWDRYFAFRKEGDNMRQASQRAGIGYTAAKAKERGLRNNSGDEYKRAIEGDNLPEPIPLDQLAPEPLRAIDDFGFFRYRYFGRRSTPWQEEAAYKVLEMLATKEKEYVVINAPPGSGKSTTFTLDIPAWITVRNRGIRGMLGSATQPLAESYLRRLRDALATTIPYKAEDEEIALGLAVDAQATLSEDFGLFRPPTRVLWTTSRFIVAQYGNRPINDKEPTWSAYGLDTAYIGGRFDVCFWDDVVEEKSLQSIETIDRHRRRWDKVAEKRLEPGGLLVLQGQRISPEDLYRYSLDKPAGRSVPHDSCCEAEPDRKYHHIRFRAHADDQCNSDHDESAAYFPQGCLLDPRRLPWRELVAEMAGDAGNYAQVYQQEDGDPTELLVDPIWISGGRDPRTGEIHPGCWDHDRDIAELPMGLSGPRISIVTADPSPTRFWAIAWWIYTPDSEYRWLMDLERRGMEAPDFLDWDNSNQRFVGLMDEWQSRSEDLGLKITHWVVEQNAAQRFMLQYEHVKRWMSQRQVTIIGHETHRNKADPKMGVSSIAPHYRHGRVRLPGGRQSGGRMASMKLVEEAVKWPKGRTDDCVMAHWFLEWNLPRVYRPKVELKAQRRPSWLKDREARRRALVAAR